MSMYERTATIERAADDGPGVVRGVLVTNGEASDGHILDVRGMELPDTAPMLFGHDDYTGERNLGSWADFTKRGNVMAKLGDQQLLAVGQIELTGKGDRADWREDMAHMIERGHVNALSVRWADGKKPPVRRINLPSDHPAFVDSEKAGGEQRWGLFFETSRLLEGSVVTLGADPGALMHCYRSATSSPARALWRYAMEAAPALDTMEREELERHFGAVVRELARLGERLPSDDTELELELRGEPDETEAPAWAAALLTRLDAIEGRLSKPQPVARLRGVGDDPEPIIEDQSRIDEFDSLVLERLDAIATRLSSASAFADEVERVTEGDPLPPIKTPREVFADIRRGLDAARCEVMNQLRADINKARGKVTQ